METMPPGPTVREFRRLLWKSRSEFELRYREKKPSVSLKQNQKSWLLYSVRSDGEIIRNILVCAWREFFVRKRLLRTDLRTNKGTEKEDGNG